MPSNKKILVVFLAIILLFTGAVDFAFAAGPSSGYVQYHVTVSSQSSSIGSVSANINETAQPSAQSGFINLTLALSSSVENFSYSRNVNSSSLLEVFPYLAGLTNQSLTYQTYGLSLLINLDNTGQVSVTFNNTSYQATKYLVSFTVSNSSIPISVYGNGTVTSLPSGLIDSLQLTVNQTATIEATLLSTNLSLNVPANNINPVGASLLGVGVIAAVLIAAPVIYKKTISNHKNQTDKDESKTPQEDNGEQGSQDEKKPYWVD